MSADTAQSPADPPSWNSFAFGPFVLVPARQLLLRNGTAVRLGGRALDILTALVERAGEVVGKRELMARAWPASVVEDCNLKVNIAALRRALGDVPEAPEYVATVAGRGYRFVTNVRTLAAAHPPLVNSALYREQRLPPLPVPVVGRAQTIAQVRLALERSRLVSLVGPGGIGKTTVALSVAQQVEDDGLATVAFVDLSRVSSGEFVPAALQSALATHAGRDSGLQGLASSFADREMLLVLDTCEHVLSAVAHVCDIFLSNCARAKVLVTTRQVLRAQNERVEWIGPLDVPPPEAPLSAERVLQFSSVQLLVARANQTGRYDLSDAEAPAIADICRRLDGAPLALELASTRLSGRSAVSVLDGLEDRFRVLRQVHAEGPLRQHSLLATLEWSYALLKPAEATVLRSVSIFAGSFDIESAFAVVCNHGLSLAETFDALSGLRTKSMLGLDQTSGAMAYRLLETTRAFAQELLDSSGESMAAAQSHARLQLNALSRAAAEHAKMPADAWRRTFAGVVDELRAALEWSLRRSFDPELGVRLVVAALPLWRELGLSCECLDSCTAALRTIDRLELVDSLVRLRLVAGVEEVTSHGRRAPKGASQFPSHDADQRPSPMPAIVPADPSLFPTSRNRLLAGVARGGPDAPR